MGTHTFQDLKPPTTLRFEVTFNGGTEEITLLLSRIEFILRNTVANPDKSFIVLAVKNAIQNDDYDTAHDLINRIATHYVSPSVKILSNESQ